MKRKLLYLYLVFVLASLLACIKDGGEVIRKKAYDPSGEVPGIVTILNKQGIVLDSYEIKDLDITPDGNELYLGASNSRYYTILVSRRTDGRWTEPEIVKSIENPKFMNI